MLRPVCVGGDARSSLVFPRLRLFLCCWQHVAFLVDEVPQQVLQFALGDDQHGTILCFLRQREFINVARIPFVLNRIARATHGLLVSLCRVVEQEPSRIVESGEGLRSATLGNLRTEDAFRLRACCARCLYRTNLCLHQAAVGVVEDASVGVASLFDMHVIGGVAGRQELLRSAESLPILSGGKVAIASVATLRTPINKEVSIGVAVYPFWSLSLAHISSCGFHQEVSTCCRLPIDKVFALQVVESELRVVGLCSNEVEDVLSVNVDSADEGRFEFHITVLAHKDWTVAVDGVPSRSVHAVSVVQLLTCRQRVGEQICFPACGVEFWSRSSGGHRLNLQFGVRNVVAYLQSAIDELAASCLLAMDGNNIVCAVELQGLLCFWQQGPRFILGVVASHLGSKQSVDIDFCILIMEEPQTKVRKTTHIETVDLEGSPYPNVAARPWSPSSATKAGTACLPT